MEEIKFITETMENIFYYKWQDYSKEPKGVIQIAHGMAEHCKRYDYFAKELAREGYIVYGNDHRGHGLSVKRYEELGHVEGCDSFETMVSDLKKVTDIIKVENYNKPIFIFGHSMGSFLVQRYIQLYGDKINGVILSGSNGKPMFYTKIAILIAALEMKLKGYDNKSTLLDKLSFGDFNSKFKPSRTKFDWLSSVEEEVDKYIADNKCGFICSSSFFYYLIKGLWRINKKENISLVPKNLSIYIFSGEKDPVGFYGKGIYKLYNKFKRLGIKDVEYKLYSDGRHEMLNEKEKEKVTENIKTWLNCRI